MESWYLPVTIVPGLGLIILSTSNLMLTLSSEISGLVTSSKKDIVYKKLAQLKLLNRAMVFLYVSVALLLISAVVNGLNSKLQIVSSYTEIFAVVCALIAIINLIIYSFRAVAIRQNQFKNHID